MEAPRLSRRRFLWHGLWLAPLAASATAADAVMLEPNWIQERTIRLDGGPARNRFVQFTDVHFKGDTRALADVVRRINRLAPDFTCFTGDLIEEAKHLPAALVELAKLRVPLYAIPGNHDHWSRARLAPLAELCRSTGGAWLADRQEVLPGGRFNLIGVDRLPVRILPLKSCFNLLLVHYPAWADRLGGHRCDLILAGHSHGGQVRLPLYGSLVTPYNTGRYDLGRFETSGGPLYVNPGIGTLGDFEFRFNCRPELTVFEV